MNLNEISDLDKRTEDCEDGLQGPKGDLKAVIESGCEALQLRKDAFKSARKLKKLKPGERRAWIKTFEATCAALGFDDQLDLEDAIEDVDHDVTITSDGMEPIKTTTGAVRRAAGRLAGSTVN